MASGFRLRNRYPKVADTQDLDEEIIDQQSSRVEINNKIDRRIRVRHVFTTTSEESFTHPLGRKPAGFQVACIDKSANVYSESEDRKWTSSKIYLTCSVANTAVTLVLF